MIFFFKLHIQDSIYTSYQPRFQLGKRDTKMKENESKITIIKSIGHLKKHKPAEEA